MLELNKLSYSAGDFFAEYTFNISKSGIYALVGESGSGKSTLINLIGGFLNVNSGSIFLDDKILASFGNSLINYSRSCLLFVVCGLHNILPVMTSIGCEMRPTSQSPKLAKVNI